MRFDLQAEGRRPVRHVPLLWESAPGDGAADWGEQGKIPMVKFWAMAPAKYSPSGTIWAEYQKCWQYDLEHGVISMGWDLGEAPKSRDHLNRL